MEKHPYRWPVLCVFSLPFFIAAGCSGTSALTRADVISVASEPPGAAVYAAGKRLGVTPMAVRQQDVFPVVFDKDQQDAYGRILLTKEGCKDHTVNVTNQVIRKGVNVKLDCGQKELAKPQGVTPGSPPPSVKERILRLNDLRDQGLVSEEEYLQIRRKILEEL